MKDEILARVRRPIQYVDGEVNAVHKRPDPSLARFALAFPDTYELGMSHQGLKILYHILNGRRDVAAERVFAPEVDLEELLRGRGEPLATLESGTPLSACDIVGFTLQSELHYTTILNMLDLGGIPLLAAERGPGAPFVLGGGPQALNPEPLADFFDAFALGDGEETIVEIAEAYLDWKRAGEDRRSFLRRLAAIEGVYVPSLYRVRYAPDGRVEAVEPEDGAPPTVTRRLVPDLNRSPIPVSPPVSFMETTHDRLTVEIARGCLRGCRFCHAGMIYRPYRERSPKVVVEAVREGLANTGYDEVSLSALSSGDYCHLTPLVGRLAAELKDRFVSISLPSIRPGSLPDDVIKDVGAVRKSGFTIAPEAATDRLRRVINKGITEEEILETAGHIFGNGWKSLKLYFMIGLPTETREDVEAIAALAGRVRRRAQDAGVQRPQITVSVSSFVPKPHTPFQWCSMAGLDYLKSAVESLHRRCRQSGISFKWHHPEMSVTEGLLCRGDRRLSRVILGVWRRGGRFEAWTDRFDLSRWQEALREEGLDHAFYTTRPRDEDEKLPWEHLGSKVSREFLLREHRRGVEGEATPPCDVGNCRACGACGDGVLTVAPAAATAEAAPAAGRPKAEDRRFRVRLRFRKTGAMKYLSHLELFRAFHRAARRAGIPLSYTGGFNPHPRFSFGPPLPVGVEGEAELVDLDLSSSCPTDRLIDGLNLTLPEGLRITGAQYFPKAAPALFESAEVTHLRFSLPVGTATPEVLRRKIEGLLAAGRLDIERDRGGKKKRKDVRPFIFKAEPGKDGTVIDLWTKSSANGTIRPPEFLELLFPEMPDLPERVTLSRLGLYRLADGRPEDAFSLPRPPALRRP